MNIIDVENIILFFSFISALGALFFIYNFWQERLNLKLLIKNNCNFHLDIDKELGYKLKVSIDIILYNNSIKSMAFDEMILLFKENKVFGKYHILTRKKIGQLEGNGGFVEISFNAEITKMYFDKLLNIKPFFIENKQMAEDFYNTNLSKKFKVKFKIIRQGKKIFEKNHVFLLNNLKCAIHHVLQ